MPRDTSRAIRLGACVEASELGSLQFGKPVSSIGQSKSPLSHVDTQQSPEVNGETCIVVGGRSCYGLVLHLALELKNETIADTRMSDELCFTARSTTGLWTDACATVQHCRHSARSYHCVVVMRLHSVGNPHRKGFLSCILFFCGHASVFRV